MSQEAAGQWRISKLIGAKKHHHDPPSHGRGRHRDLQSRQGSTWERVPPIFSALSSRTRANSKQARVLGLLRRPSGATIATDPWSGALRRWIARIQRAPPVAPSSKICSCAETLAIVSGLCSFKSLLRPDMLQRFVETPAAEQRKPRPDQHPQASAELS
jgi:hypothetical protein